MGEKDKMIINYLEEVKKFFVKINHPIEEETFEKYKTMFLNSDSSFEDIRKQIDKLVEQKLEEIKTQEELLNRLKEKITELPINVGITLNMQQIDILSIINSNSKEELVKNLSKIVILDSETKDELLSQEKDLEEIKKDIVTRYQESLTSYNDYHFSLDKQEYKKELNKRLKYIVNNVPFDDAEKQLFLNILKESSTTLEEKVVIIKETLNRSTSEKIFSLLSRLKFVEKEGIKDTSYEAFVELAKHFKDYDIINVDEVAKYSSYVRSDDGYNREDLIKVLDFAKENGKQVRLNALLFYMDIPDKLDRLPNTPQNKELVKNKLRDYIDDISKLINEYNEQCKKEGKKPVVKTVEVLNELLNRFSMDGIVNYDYRGNIDTDDHRVTKDNPLYDHIRGGWLRFLSVEDLCEIVEDARRNLPDVEFMINETNLEDPKKIEGFKDLIMDKIHAYEEEHQVKLIDSIGTQMHLDENSKVYSKEDIIEMFKALSQLGYPFEITEYDLRVSDSFINSHTEDEINAYKNEKEKELCQAIVEFRKQLQISGITIWSVSDLQNFMVNIENEKIFKENIKRVNNGLEPLKYVKNLYGGYYNSHMKDRTNKKEINVTYNYHTHTYRSGHSDFSSDEEMLQSAINNGIKTIGFSEHIPNSPYMLPEPTHRMLSSELGFYLSSMEELKQAHPNINILTGFEAEYTPENESYLIEMRDKVNYMILGEHYIPGVEQKGNPDYPIEYAKMVCKAIESGLFDIVAHPDVFMKYRDSITDEKSKELFDKNAVAASKSICDKAKEMGIPVEINLNPAINNEILRDGSLEYPTTLFWQVAATIPGLKVIEGVDAHTTKAFEKTREARKLVSNIYDLIQDKMVPDDYNPRNERDTNNMLKSAYLKTKENAISQEAVFVDKVLHNIGNRIPDNVKGDDVIALLNEGLNQTTKRCLEDADKRQKETVNAGTEIETNNNYQNTAQKRRALDRNNSTLKEINIVSANQSSLIEKARNNVSRAVNLGCSNKNDIISTAVNITDRDTTQSEKRRTKIDESLSKIKETAQAKKEKNKALTKKKKDNSGFANMITVLLISTFAAGFVIGVVFMIFNYLS